MREMAAWRIHRLGGVGIVLLQRGSLAWHGGVWFTFGRGGGAKRTGFSLSPPRLVATIPDPWFSTEHSTVSILL